LIVVFWRDWITQVVLGFPQHLTVSYVEAHGSPQVFAAVLLRLPALVLLLLLLRRPHQHHLRQAVTMSLTPRLIIPVGITIVITIFLNNSGLWPYPWRWPGSSIAAYMKALADGGQWVGLALWLMLIGIVNPLLEEVVFRFGVLQIVRDTTRSNMLSIVTSSLSFAATHLGYLPPDRAHILDSVWIFIVSLPLAWYTLRQDGNLTVPFLIHATFNVVAYVVLFTQLI